jgi:hypothetical protein
VTNNTESKTHFISRGIFIEEIKNSIIISQLSLTNDLIS